MTLPSIGRRHAPFDSTAAIVEDYARGGVGSPSRLAEYWRSLKGGQPVSVLAVLAKREIEARFARGERPAALEYLERFPELAGRGDLVVSLVYEEFCLLEEGGAAPSVGQFCERYRPWSDSIASQLGYHRELSRVAGVEPAEDRYPKVGERFATYTLQEILGRGGAAKVYRAIDDLGRREVVLKVSRTMGLEPSILAALNHDNIVKIHHEVQSNELGLKGICMPYHPGVTLDAALAALVGRSDDPRPPRRARALWEALGLRDLDPTSAARYWGGFPVAGAYSEAVAWIGAVLADALQHAHKLGVFHRDIKPANILIARREGPLLFDFNLAHRHSDAARAQDAMSGGTLPYMAPEQLRAFVDPALWGQVEAGADVYALGLVLRELATGRKPPLPTPGLSLARSIQDLLDGRPELARSVREEYPDVPPALDAIIRKCLAPRVQDRYAEASQLAEDLRRFLDRRPLLVADNPSRLELAMNWAYRKRRAALGLAASLLVGSLAVLAVRPFASHQEHPAALSHGPDGATPAPDPTPPPRKPPAKFYPGEATDLFRVRVMLLGGNSARAKEARAMFDRLTKAHPESGWPLAYKAFAADRLDQQPAPPGQKVPRHEISPNTHDGIQDALKKEDGVVALESWRSNPAAAKSITYMIGNHFAHKRRFDQATTYYRLALEADPSDASPCCGLGDVARQQDQGDRAIEWYKRGLNLLDPDERDGDLDRAHDLYYRILVVKFKEVDRVLRDRPDPGAWPAVRALLEDLAEHLGRLEGTQGLTRPEEAKDRDAYLIAGFRARLESAWGYYLDRAEGQAGQAQARFDEASRQFRVADELADRPHKALLAESSPSNLKRWKNVLACRMQECGHGRPAGDGSATKIASAPEPGSP